MADDETAYLLRRAAEEKRRASQTPNQHARRAHLALARCYETKLGQSTNDDIGVLGAEPLKRLVHEMIG